MCPYCGHDYRVAMAGQGMAPKKESAMPIVGGILVIIASLIELGVGGLFAAGGTALFGVSLGATGFLVACGAIVIILGIIALLGGIFAIQRKHFGIAVLGGIFSLLGLFIFGLIGLILIAVSRDEFHD